MHARLLVLSLALASSALAFACDVEVNNPPPATAANPPPAPVTTVVLDGGAAPVTTSAPVATAAPVATVSPVGAPASVADPPDGGDFFSCSTTADCAVVPKNDCCHNGYNVSVNNSQIDAYRASGPKCDPRRKCPMYRILDRRVPNCNAGKCELVQPDAGAAGTPTP